MESTQKAHPPLSLLIVEDDYEASEIMRAVTANAFPQLRVQVAENGKQGLDLCREHHPDIVVTDINMPKVDGVSMAAEIRAMKADTRLIVVTGYRDKIEEFREIGARDVIAKPIEFKKLFAAIEGCIEEIGKERRR